MKSKWSEPFLVKEIEHLWDSIPLAPAIYILSCDRKIPRIAGDDKSGILYIGKSKKIRQRLTQLWSCNHPATGFLWKYPEVASLMFSKKIRSKTEVEKIVELLSIKYALVDSNDQLSDSERAVLHSYLFHYGELPPLNYSLPERWKDFPKKRDLNWWKIKV